MSGIAARSSFVLLAACVAFLVGCGESEPPKLDASAVLVVFVDGVAGAQDAELWAEELGSGATTGEMIGVSTSLSASLASALTGLEPPEHGKFSAKEYRAFVSEWALWVDYSSPFGMRGGVSTRRDGTDGVARAFGTPHLHLPTRDLEYLFARLAEDDAEVEEARADGKLDTQWFEAPRIQTVVVDRPRAAAPWPDGLAEELERSVRPLLEADGRAIPETLDGWYERTLLAHYEEPLDGAFHRAWSRALLRQTAARAETLASMYERWTVFVVGVRTRSMADGVVDLDERLPYCALGSGTPPAAPAELRDLLLVLGKRVNLSAPARERTPSAGLWRGSELVGSRDRWSMVERATESGTTIELLDPPASGLVLELASDAEPVDATLVAHVDDALIAADLGATVRLPERNGRRLELRLEPGDRVVVHTRRRAPDLLMEFVRAGAALDPETMFVGAYPLRRTEIPRVLDADGPELDEAELASRVRVTREPKGVVRVNVLERGQYGDVHQWPPPDRWLEHEEDADGFEVRLFGPARIAVTVRRDGWRDVEPDVLDDDWDQPDAMLEAHELAFDGHAPAGDALRLLWPPQVTGHPEPPPTVPAGALRVTALGPFLMDLPPEPDLRAFLSTLGDHE